MAFTVALRLILAKKIPLLLSSAPMLGLASFQTWIILNYARADLPFSLVSHFIGPFLLSPLFLILLGILGFYFSWKRIATQNDLGSVRKWFCIMPFTCLLALSVAALLRGLIHYWDNSTILSIPASTLWGTLAAMILIMFIFGGRASMKSEEERTFSRLFLAWIASTPIIMAVLFFMPKPAVFPLLWVVTMCMIQFSAASAFMNRLICWPLGKLALKAALAEGFILLPLWLFAAVLITSGPIIS